MLVCVCVFMCGFLLSFGKTQQMIYIFEIICMHSYCIFFLRFFCFCFSFDRFFSNLRILTEHVFLINKIKIKDNMTWFDVNTPIGFLCGFTLTPLHVYTKYNLSIELLLLLLYSTLFLFFPLFYLYFLCFIFSIVIDIMWMCVNCNFQLIILFNRKI